MEEEKVSVIEKPKKQKTLLISAILALAWLILAFYAFFSATSSLNGAAEQIGAAIIGSIIIPLLIVGCLGLLFNVLGWALNKRGFVLTAGILYCVSLIAITYNFGLIPSIVLTFIGYAKIKKG